VVLPESVLWLGAGAFRYCPELTSLTLGENVAFSTDTWKGTLFSGADGRVREDFLLKGWSWGIAQEYAQMVGCSFEAIGVADGEYQGKAGDVKWWFDSDTGFMRLSGEGQLPDYNGTWMMNEEHRENWDDTRELAPWTDLRDRIRVLVVEGGVENISENAFENCNNLIAIHLHEGVKRIGFQGFLASAVENLVLPDSLEQVGAFAFNHNKQLKRVRTTADLSFGAFNSCSALEEFWCGHTTQMTVLDNGTTPFNHGTQPGEESLPEFYLECLESEKVLPELATDLWQCYDKPGAKRLFDDDWDRKYTHGLPVERDGWSEEI
jgi:hypothetical protein